MAADGHVVDPNSAEQLARTFDAFTPVQIRETLELEPFTDAMRLLARFARAAEPYRELKHYALVNQLGYYRSRADRFSAVEEHERYLAFMRTKEAVHWAKKGTALTAAQRDDLTRAFYAPAYRAEMAKLSAASWRECLSPERELREDAGTGRDAEVA